MNAESHNGTSWLQAKRITVRHKSATRGKFVDHFNAGWHVKFGQILCFKSRVFIVQIAGDVYIHPSAVVDPTAVVGGVFVLTAFLIFILPSCIPSVFLFPRGLLFLSFYCPCPAWLYCAVLCCAVLCCAVLCCAVLRCAALRCTVLCCAVLCCAVLYCTVLCCAVLCCAVLYCTVLCCTVLYCAVLYCTVLCCAVLCCAVLCCTVLYCTVLYCTVLYCAVLCCAVLYSTVLCCTVLCCAVLCCAALRCAALRCAALHCTALHCTVCLSLPREWSISNFPCSHLLTQVKDDTLLQ